MKSSNNNIFIIDDAIDNDTDKNPLTANQYSTVTFNNIDFLGCDTNCATNGGIIFNKEYLTITNSVIAKGVASDKGGAIYNAADAVLSIKNSVLKLNRADSGSADRSYDFLVKAIKRVLERDRHEKNRKDFEKSVEIMTAGNILANKGKGKGGGPVPVLTAALSFAAVMASELVVGAEAAWSFEHALLVSGLVSAAAWSLAEVSPDVARLGSRSAAHWSDCKRIRHPTRPPTSRPYHPRSQGSLRT